MLYRVTFADGSQELVEGDNIREAREEAKALYDQPIKRVVVEEAEDEELDNPDDEEEEEEEVPGD